MLEKVEEDQVKRQMDLSNYFEEKISMLGESCDAKNNFKRLLHFFDEERKERKNFVQLAHSKCFEFFNDFDDLLDEDKNDFFKKMEKNVNHFVRWTNHFQDLAKLEITQFKNNLDVEIEDQND